MASPICFVGLLTAALCVLGGVSAHAAFTPLEPLTNAAVVKHAEAYPGGNYEPIHLLDGQVQTEFASNNKGTNTFVTVQFPQTVRIAAVRYRDRNDPATVSRSEFVFTGENGEVTRVLSLAHGGTRGAETMYTFSTAVSARTVEWRVSALGPAKLGTVGGAELTFFAGGKPEDRPSKDVLSARAEPFVEKNGGTGLQPIKLSVSHPYAEPAQAILRIPGSDPLRLVLQPGTNSVTMKLPMVQSETVVPLALEIEGQKIAELPFTRKPVRPLTVFILPHSHTDIGYTEIQTAIETKQVQNLLDGIAHARRTASYPKDARFVWNVEVLWAADLYLHRLNDAQRRDFFDAVKQGQVALCGMYLNELTGLCRPEELVQLFRYATELGKETGQPIDSAMISDVPGYTWGTVTAMAQAGIKYFSTAPNYFDRIGTLLREWENKPFWWVGPDGQSKVLVWIPFWGYAMSHRYGSMSTELVEDFCEGLEKRAYPYNIAYARWSGHGDNAVPDPAICDFIRDWNAKFEWPHFIISGTSQAFAALEKQYGEVLPTVRGDWTPYWEDGAGSSARETALNRQSSDRLVQAETLFAMLQPKRFPVQAFTEAWQNVLLYSEHTWGADCSISQPESKKTREQWDIKQKYALQADRQSRQLLAEAVRGTETQAPNPNAPLQFINTTSWPRTELVLVPAAASAGRDRVLDASGTSVPSQRLADGQLAVLARAVPPFSSKTYQLVSGQPGRDGSARVEGATLDNGLVRVRIDERTGAIAELTARGVSGNLVDASRGEAVNQYLYLPGDDLNDLRSNGPVTITPGEPGPLVASLVIESDAPGCIKLRREIRLVAGLDYVECLDLVDKARLQAKSYSAKNGKESVNFAFPFQVPDGEIRLDIPLGVMIPEADQMPSACKNWFTVGRWADVSNQEQGITWVSLDAPLVEIGGITANLLNSQTNPDVWRKKVDRTQRLYSWAMNNHWGTNYRAYQEGPILFRYILRPHQRFDSAEASRFAIGFSQPLVPAFSLRSAPQPSLLRVNPPELLVSALKPSADGRGQIVRLFNASSTARQANISWGAGQPKALFLSDTSEVAKQPVSNQLTVPGYGLVTLRAEFEKP